MSGTKLTPEKITSPFQLMAAWFAMLVLLVTIFLAAAAKITNPPWITAYLVIFASILTLVVVGCVLLMLTLFRPHLQDGDQYASWLKDRNSYFISDKKSQFKSSATEFVLAPLPSTRETLTTSEHHDSCFVSIVNIDGAATLKERLTTHGYPAEIYESPKRKKITSSSSAAQEAIWIGSNLPPSTVVNVVKLAVKEWPHLKYLHLSGDHGSPPDEIHEQIFLGGATSTAMRYGLRPWTTEEIEGLDAQVTSEQFRAVIRSHYGYKEFGSFG